MQQEASYIADEFEMIGRQIMTQCEDLPEYILHWSPPLPQGRSLFESALEAITIIEEWIMIPVGGVPFSTFSCSKKSSIDTFTYLQAGYEQWMQEVRKLLDVLPNSLLDCYVEHSQLSEKRRADKNNAITIRSLLLHALVQLGIIAGKMQLLHHFFEDGERIVQEHESIHTN
jgi:hypothetical protein